ncbi:MAG: exodeoxyribonuclease VII large subunit [Sodaliphilus sp.]|jgi:exodeoxyribonuclease VII large subunit|nr:exodeoxyribonuclease VII large subunit [Bacteroidales bacterium]MDY2671605.1 exodeoxyribonuclease VII large subunit [Sodaliphilus sp.]HAO63522.1 exodeoxyribonuclease VII large subunit [Porphyromonadaceae bacterium]MCI7490660.1 exodeoxyribonuclease VII large subunit [Bacteroidales bacterium]MDD7018848.1 exodeoxyribonuclease VII large subunit [Bacteroidales bacterium]
MAEITDTALQGTSKSPNTITLQEFNNRIKRLLADPSVMNCWVVAETTDVRINQHCYLQLLEKNPKTGATVAKIKAIIWGNQFRFLNARFKQVTGRDIGNDMKIMVCLSVNYSPQYGLTVVINDINPEFTLGDMERQRQEILNRLTQEGIIGQNKTVPVPPVLQRIAIVSAAGAAGYGDFMKQLTDNKYGVCFYPCLFQATMQGVKTVPTVLAALDKVEQNQHLFDCVVIIRGGGGTEELNSFDNYDLARRVATFPLPVIVGIGHERDITVLDYVAGIRVKTPTAAAEHIILQAANALAHIGDLSNQVVSIARDYIARAKEQLSYYAGNLPIMAQRIIDTNTLRLQNFIQNIPLHVQRRIEGENAQLARQKDAIKNAVAQVKMKETMRLEALGDKIELLSPRKVMARGYTLTTCEGKIMTDAAQLEAGKLVTIHFRDGKVVAGTQSVIKDK